MILSFAKTPTKTERIWNGERSGRVPPDVQGRALDKLRLLNRAKTMDDLKNPPSNHLEKMTKERHGQFSIRINKQWRICFLWKGGNAYDVEITDYPNPDWLHNSHAGELLVSEFMKPLALTDEALAASLGVNAVRVRSVISGKAPMDADLDLRLARYFRMSEGFFLGLQVDHDLLEAKRAMNGELDRILPIAA